MKLVHLLIPASLALFSTGSFAALDIGEDAPKFTANVSINGQAQSFSLSDELRKGPVVVYFFPSSFTTGCSIEAHNFAEAIDQFKAAGATVVGISRDDMDTQKKFSVSACNGKFAVAADTDLAIAKSYDAILATRPDYANRISYVVAPNGKIIYRYSSLNPDKHIINTLNAVKELHAQAR
ncbi:peroxiredoxin [Undibacterium terreum]|uniref:thioredoxin-dependent peroxiredoxin n=1 Tax=Undibacterium terreum TaxID=1224302 RepID=A0A916U869_9BURK|nr:peroxiredoxin [Undibacterium terreum]GGC62734.1 peroxiredoxin [Undibacterium terreum]